MSIKRVHTCCIFQPAFRCALKFEGNVTKNEKGLFPVFVSQHLKPGCLCLVGRLLAQNEVGARFQICYRPEGEFLRECLFLSFNVMAVWPLGCK